MIVEHVLRDVANRVRTGPNPRVVHVSTVDGWPVVWLEVDALVPDMDDPVYRSTEIVFDVVVSGQPSPGVRPYHRHVGSTAVADRMLHVYLVTGEATSAQVLEHRRSEAMRVLRRSAPGEALRMRVINRDRQRCRFCGNGLSFNLASSTVPSDRRATYVILDLWDEVDDDNVYLSCERCCTRKGIRTLAEANMKLLPEPRTGLRPGSDATVRYTTAEGDTVVLSAMRVVLTDGRDQ